MCVAHLGSEVGPDSGPDSGPKSRQNAPYHLREFALAVPPIGGLAAAQTLLRPYGSRRLRFYCAILGSKVWSPSGVGGYQEVAGSENEEALAKVQSDPSETIIVSHLAKAASQG